jgi:hypothetical protein
LDDIKVVDYNEVNRNENKIIKEKEHK